MSGKDQEIQKTFYTPATSLGSELTNSISEAMGSIKRQIQADKDKILKAAGCEYRLGIVEPQAWKHGKENNHD